MGIPVAKVGSSGFGICVAHAPSPIVQSGVIVNGAPTVLAEGTPVARLGSIMMGGDGHTGTVISGSGTVLAGGIGVAQLGGSFVGTFSGTILNGATTVLAG